MKKLVVIIPYFGSLPRIFKFWYQSALNNPTIDFLLFTDTDITENQNIHVIKLTFKDMQKKIQDCFDFPIALNQAYKLCDFRPAYGFIFADYIKPYDFWGFGDIDLIYGNIRDFITDKVLNNYDLISGWGHLTFYKNNHECNTFFKKEIQGFQKYKDVFSTPKSCFFDEYNHKGMGDLWKYLYPQKVWDIKPFDDIRVPYLNFNFISEFHPEYSNNLIFEYENKNLYRIYTNINGETTKESTLYAHFQKRNILKFKTNNTSHYLIIPNSFINYKPITNKRIRKWGKQQKFKRDMWNLKNKIIRRVNIIINKITNSK